MIAEYLAQHIEIRRIMTEAITIGIRHRRNRRAFLNGLLINKRKGIYKIRQ